MRYFTYYVAFLILATLSSVFVAFVFWIAINDYNHVSFLEVWNYSWAATLSFLILHSAASGLAELRNE